MVGSKDAHPCGGPAFAGSPHHFHPRKTLAQCVASKGRGANDQTQVDEVFVVAQLDIESWLMLTNQSTFEQQGFFLVAYDDDVELVQEIIEPLNELPGV